VEIEKARFCSKKCNCEHVERIQEEENFTDWAERK